jgi:ABC-2 type transport system ATP-binding protein
VTDPEASERGRAPAEPPPEPEAAPPPSAAAPDYARPVSTAEAATAAVASAASAEPAERQTDQPQPALPSPDAVVAMVDVSRTFGDRVVVRNLDLTIERGSILGVIGPSGSGKTTTVRMLTGALKPTSGDIRVLGEQPENFKRETRERIGYMPQLFTLYPDLTARENVDFVGSLFGMLWPRRRRRTRQVLELLELWDARGRRASNMSGGMQRRLELACALVHEPVLLFLDEPTAGIDPILRGKVWDELHRLRDDGRTIVVTTQYVGDAEDCDQVALIAEGRLVALGTPDELRQQALGGDAVLVETAALFDSTSLDNVPGVIAITQRGPREITATVEDSAVALPVLVEAVRAANGEVVAAQELRPTFDEIFAILVERAKARTAVDAAEADRERAAEPAA